MHDHPCRSIAPTTSERDRYVEQINALAAKAWRRKRLYVPPFASEEAAPIEEPIEETCDN